MAAVEKGVNSDTFRLLCERMSIRLTGTDAVFGLQLLQGFPSHALVDHHNLSSVITN
jgi:hypothetical protein